MPAAILLVLCAGPLDEARAALGASRLDEVLFALDGQPVTAEDRPEVVDLLSRAAARALSVPDVLLALQFAQMALAHDAEAPVALEVAARASLAQQQFGAAEGYADRWIRARPGSGPARLLRAELAAEAGEWQIVLDQLAGVKLTGADAELKAQLTGRATAELSARREALSQVAALERQLMKAAARARASDTRAGAVASSSGITVYTTRWCGYCKQAKAYLRKKGLSFVERDIERDEGAAEELAHKALAAGVRPGGVPVIDVRGQLVVGFDPRALDRAL